MDILHTHINNHDLTGLREYWHFLDQRLFSRLEQTYTPSIRKLETSLLKLYIVNAVQSNKPDKVMEFFERMTSELQGQAEWRDWFGVYIMTIWCSVDQVLSYLLYGTLLPFIASSWQLQRIKFINDFTVNRFSDAAI